MNKKELSVAGSGLGEQDRLGMGKGGRFFTPIFGYSFKNVEPRFDQLSLRITVLLKKMQGKKGCV